uniref:DUF3778 domain-containing protein n=1 Tax=Oryza meridionalis TaxID=40149 RepID=A0A0E0CC08_9ORYZ
MWSPSATVMVCGSGDVRSEARWLIRLLEMAPCGGASSDAAFGRVDATLFLVCSATALVSAGGGASSAAPVSGRVDVALLLALCPATASVSVGGGASSTALCLIRRLELPPCGGAGRVADFGREVAALLFAVAVALVGRLGCRLEPAAPVLLAAASLVSVLPMPRFVARVEFSLLRFSDELRGLLMLAESGDAYSKIYGSAANLHLCRHRGDNRMGITGLSSVVHAEGGPRLHSSQHCLSAVS